MGKAGSRDRSFSSLAGSYFLWGLEVWQSKVELAEAEAWPLCRIGKGKESGLREMLKSGEGRTGPYT